MDKQTCAALLNMLGFDSYDITFNEWVNDTKLYNSSNPNIFLLKTNSTNFVGSVVNTTSLETTFKTYDAIIIFARQINETETKRN